MKQFSYLCAGALILGCQGVTLSLAGDSEIGSALLQNKNGVQAQSAESVRSSTQFQNVEGTLKEIQGNVYVVEGKATQQPIRVENWAGIQPSPTVKRSLARCYKL